MYRNHLSLLADFCERAHDRPFHPLMGSSKPNTLGRAKVAHFERPSLKWPQALRVYPVGSIENIPSEPETVFLVWSPLGWNSESKFQVAPVLVGACHSPGWLLQILQEDAVAGYLDGCVFHIPLNFQAFCFISERPKLDQNEPNL